MRKQKPKEIKNRALYDISYRHSKTITETLQNCYLPTHIRYIVYVWVVYLSYKNPLLVFKSGFEGSLTEY